MRFGWKIFLLCMGIYVIALTITGFVVTENTYNSLLNKEVERSLEEESNLHSTLLLYLINNKRIAKEKIHLENYSKSIVDTFKADRSYLEVYDEPLNLLASNAPKAWFLPREELNIAANGQKNFMIRREEGNTYLFVSNMLQVEEEKIIISLIKDISYIDNHKSEQYLFFAKTGLTGLIVFALITLGISNMMMRPINELSITAQNIASGNYKGRVKINSRDEIGLLAKQFNIMAAEIEHRINQLKREGVRQQRFIDNLTHELRTPLTSIIGYAEFLLKTKYDQQIYQKSLGYIYSEGNRLLRLSKTLMEMILIREKELDFKEASALRLLKEIKGIMDVKAEQKNIQIIVKGEETKLLLDWDLFKVAIINLVDNALNASAHNSSVTLGIEQKKNQIIIYVEDEGKGMAVSEIAKITEPFYRIEKSRSRREGGIGLGLAICHQIVEEHEGKLQINSEIGQGTRVEIVFPARIYNSVTSQTNI